MTLLMFAAEQGQLALVEALLERGANVNIQAVSAHNRELLSHLDAVQIMRCIFVGGIVPASKCTHRFVMCTG